MLHTGQIALIRNVLRDQLKKLYSFVLTLVSSGFGVDCIIFIIILLYNIYNVLRFFILLCRKILISLIVDILASQLSKPYVGHTKPDI